MLLFFVAIIFVVLLLLSMPIVFSLAVAGIVGLWLGGYPMQQLPSALVSGSQSWVLLAIPAFVFAGGLMERCGMSHALVEFARSLVGWVRGGLGGAQAAVPLVVPVVILGGFFFGIITATEAGAVVAAYAFLAAKLYYRNVPWGEMARIAYDSAILTAAVIFLLAVASIFQYLMGMQGVPKLLGEVLEPLKDHHC